MLRALRSVLLAIGAALLVAMVVVVSVQIIYRYALGNPLIWTEEVARLIFMWTVFLGSAYAATSSSHLRLDLYSAERFKRMRQLSRIAGAVGAAVFSAVVVYSGWKIVELTATRSLPGTGLSYAWFHSAAPIGSALTLLGAVFVVLRHLRGKRDESAKA